MDEIVKFLLWHFGPNAVFIVVIAWLIYRHLNHTLEERLERLKTDLKILETEHRIRFGSQFERIAKGIEEGHSLLVELKRSLHALVSVAGVPTQESWNEADRALRAFQEWSDHNALYLSKDLLTQINGPIERAIDIIVGMRSVVHCGRTEGGYDGEATRDWNKEFHRFHDVFVPVVGKLRREFRAALGLEGAKQLPGGSPVGGDEEAGG